MEEKNSTARAYGILSVAFSWYAPIDLWEQKYYSTLYYNLASLSGITYRDYSNPISRIKHTSSIYGKIITRENIIISSFQWIVCRQKSFKGGS